MMMMPDADDYDYYYYDDDDDDDVVMEGETHAKNAQKEANLTIKTFNFKNNFARPGEKQSMHSGKTENCPA